MKRIKTFALFEASRKDMLEAFKKEVESSKWSDALIALGCNLDMRSPGRINVIGAGSKTSVFSVGDGRYGHKSLSQGRIFGEAYYPTLEECLKGLYFYVLRKKVRVQLKCCPLIIRMSFR